MTEAADTPRITAEPTPFTVHVSDEQLADLRRRVRDTRWSDDFGNDAEWRYGVSREWLRDLTDYWVDGFDWRAQEAEINSFPQFRAEIDGVTIHYIHVRGKGPNPKPIILSHGWPWTFWDWKKIIGPLSDPEAYGGDPADSFDVVVPSLPGFGFSSPLRTTGLGDRRIADLWVVLMRDVLGYDRFAVGGGDWGSTISGEVAHGYPEHVIGAWLTLPRVPGVNLRALTRDDFAEDEAWMWERTLEAQPTIQSHFTVQRLEPQTLAYALTDSPVGMAAWILGRRRNWGDHDGDVYSLFDRDFLCTTASIYWFTETIGSSMRIYFEGYVGGSAPASRHGRPRAIDVPTGFAVFPKELLLMPKSVAERSTNLHRWTLMPKGGHFPPQEQPELVVHELREMFRDLK